jgi:hypothetical protein
VTPCSALRVLAMTVQVMIVLPNLLLPALRTIVVGAICIALTRLEIPSVRYATLTKMKVEVDICR